MQIVKFLFFGALITVLSYSAFAATRFEGIYDEAEQTGQTNIARQKRQIGVIEGLFIGLTGFGVALLSYYFGKTNDIYTSHHVAAHLKSQDAAYVENLNQESEKLLESEVLRLFNRPKYENCEIIPYSGPHIRVPRKVNNPFEWVTRNFPIETVAQLLVMGRYFVQHGAPGYHALQMPTSSIFRDVIMRTVQTINGLVTVPEVIRAVITPSDLPGGNRPNIPQTVRNQMQLMGAIQGDDAGHLVAFSMGGGMDNVFNYAPQSSHLNRHVGGATPTAWIQMERETVRFLNQDSTNGQSYSVEWIVIPIYRNLANGETRPIGFCLQYTYYTGGQVSYRSPDFCFNNDPNAREDCTYAMKG